MSPKSPIKSRVPLQQQSDSHQTIPVKRRRSSRLQARQRSQTDLQLLQRVPLQQQSNAHQTIPVTRRQSSSLQSKQRSQSLLEQATDLSPIKVSTLVRSRTQFQETQNHQASAERSLKRARLTEENLRAFDKMLGQSKNPATELPTGTSKTASTTDSRFPVLASKNGIHWGPNAKPPTNLKFLQDRANRSRANWSRVNWCQDAESPTQVEYKDYVFNLDYAENEGAVVAAASKLLKTYLPVATTGYRRGINLPFKDFPKGVGFNNELSPAQPDLFEGFAIQKFNAFPVSGQLAAAIPYSTKNSITLPHFAGEWEGPGKDLDLAQIQAAYDGASIVYARNEARLFLGSPDPIGSAHVITFTSNGTSINTFANYSLERRDGQIEYHQYPMTSTFITANHEDFTEGRRQLRNLQDYAKETSEKLRDELNEKWLALGLLDTGDHDEDGFNLNDAPQPVTSNRRLKLQYNFGIGILVMSVMCCIVAVLFRTLS